MNLPQSHAVAALNEDGFAADYLRGSTVMVTNKNPSEVRAAHKRASAEKPQPRDRADEARAPRQSR